MSSLFYSFDSIFYIYLVLTIVAGTIRIYLCKVEYLIAGECSICNNKDKCASKVIVDHEYL